MSQSNCQGPHDVCEVNSDCCAGYECRRVAEDGDFVNVCRAVSKESKDKLPRTQLNWWKRRLRGDSSRVNGPVEPEDELLEDKP